MRMKWQNTCKAHSTYLGDSINISHHADSPSGSPVHPITLNLNLQDTLSSYHSLSQIPLMVYKMGYEVKSKLGIQALCLQPMLQLCSAFLPFSSKSRAHPTLSRTLNVSYCYTFAYAMLTLFPAPQIYMLPTSPHTTGPIHPLRSGSSLLSKLFVFTYLVATGAFTSDSPGFKFHFYAYRLREL